MCYGIRSIYGVFGSDVIDKSELRIEEIVFAVEHKRSLVMVVIELLRRAVHLVTYVPILQVNVCAETRKKLIIDFSIYVSVGLLCVVAIVFMVGIEYDSVVIINLHAVFQPYIRAS